MTTYVAYKGPIKKYIEIVPRKKQKKKKKTKSEDYQLGFHQ